MFSTIQVYSPSCFPRTAPRTEDNIIKYNKAVQKRIEANERLQHFRRRCQNGTTSSPRKMCINNLSNLRPTATNIFVLPKTDRTMEPSLHDQAENMIIEEKSDARRSQIVTKPHIYQSIDCHSQEMQDLKNGK